MLRKIFTLILSLFFVITFTFFLMKAIPGDPFLQEKVIPKEILQNLYAYYGLDQPLSIQYLKYLKGFLTGDLGPSLVYQGRTVNEVIAEGLPVSALLGTQALALSFVLGTTLGSLSAFYKKNKKLDTCFMLFAVFGTSVPSFLIATLLQYIFSIQLNLLPVARWGSFAHTILPTLSLAAMPTAFIAKLTRSSMIDTLQQNYIQLAYVKGLNSFRVVTRHAFKNSLLPVISYLGPVSAHILTGSFVVEKIFGIPGLGQWLILSISNRDYPMILGLSAFFSFILIFLVFIVDLLYEWIDPRIELFKKREKVFHAS